ncbi:MAG: hypothetical protein WBA13_21355 [Microcoleaceae cyanobacterium]
MRKKLTAIFVLLAICLSLIVLPQTAFAQEDCMEDLGISSETKERVYLDTCSIGKNIPFEYEIGGERVFSTAFCSETPKKFVGRQGEKVLPKSSATIEMLDLVCAPKYAICPCCSPTD